MERKLAAILHADVQGYSRLIEKDEVGTLRVLTLSLQMMNEPVRQHGGRLSRERGRTASPLINKNMGRN